MTCRGWRFREWGDERIAAQAPPVVADVEASLALAPRLNPVASSLGTHTWRYFSALATLGAIDLTTARVVEPHLDALAILEQADEQADSAQTEAIGAGPDSVWGVFAANGPGHALEARAAEVPERFTLHGSKPWCSLGDRLTHALVTAADKGSQRLFAVPLEPGRVSPAEAVWAPAGLAGVRTLPLTFDGAEAVPVGGPGWYLERPGFAWGGIGVAAVWFGGAAAVAGRLLDAADRREPDQIALAALGRADRSLHCALLALQDAARAIDAGRAAGADGITLAARVRAVVAASVDEVLQTVGHALGPAPLSQDAEHARRVADLTLYVRQHHAERDLAALGRCVLGRAA